MKSNAKRKTFINNMITYGMVVAAYIIMQVLVGTGHISSLMKGLLVPFCIYVIMAVSLNLTVGILGELSLGHAGFMCVGAFAGALFSKCMKGAIDPTLGMVIAILIGAVTAALFGVIIGIPVLRLRGDYLAIVTLAFGEIIKNLVNAVYLGRDALGKVFGLDISFKDSMSLKLGEGRGNPDPGRPGHYGNAPGSHLYHRCYPGAYHPVHCHESGELPHRPCHHGYPGQPHCSGVHRHQYHQVQAAGIFHFRWTCRYCRCAPTI